ncbi:hypothetical protein LIER_28912 [Lithospermum erythrorhizon]|uniref:CCHC-type domain-containing protein n=1 Tax=Lithospermum erythrorhizon TaxID=34254 RepID=A0AAV3RIY4_LITER
MRVLAIGGGNLRLSLTARGEDPVSWECFVALFRENYCMSTHMDALERDLILMIQGDRSVEEYERRFSKLCHLLRAVHPTEEKRINRFRDGLTWAIHHHISLMTFTSFHELRNAVLKVEMELAEPEASGVKRGRHESISTSRPSSWRSQRRMVQQTRPDHGRFSAAVIHPSYSAAPSTQRMPARSSGFHGGITRVSSAFKCFRCSHTGHRRQECWVREMICFRCQQPGHLARTCPQSSRAGFSSTSSPIPFARGGNDRGNGGCFGGRGGLGSGLRGFYGSVAGSNQSGTGRGQIHGLTQQEAQGCS